MSTTVIYEKIQKLKLEMILDGWDIEEKYSNDGWKGHPGYTIWAKREDWHEKYACLITGHSVTFWTKCENFLCPFDMLGAVSTLRKRTQKAWKDFPNSVPCQNRNGDIVEDFCVTPFHSVLKIADLMEKTKIFSE